MIYRRITVEEAMELFHPQDWESWEHAEIELVSNPEIELVPNPCFVQGDIECRVVVNTLGEITSPHTVLALFGLCGPTCVVQVADYFS